MPNPDAPPCECDWLERKAANPDVPIFWDEMTGEYQLRWGPDDAKASSIFYHCPFCGGRAPASRRDKLFAVIPEAESVRLLRLTSGFDTLDEVIDAFGEPDHDFGSSERLMQPERGDDPPTVQAARVLQYSGLSETAEVRFSDWGRAPISVMLIGKYIGLTPN